MLMIMTPRFISAIAFGINHVSGVRRERVCSVMMSDWVQIASIGHYSTPIAWQSGFGAMS